MSAPLHAGAASPAGRGAGNAGLWWAKFCDTWKPDFTGLDEPDRQTGTGGGKLRWIRRAGGTTGDRRLLQELHHRRCALVAALSGICLPLRLQSRHVTGTGLEHPVENGMLFHHTLGVPYLPGSSVKGLMRAWAGHVLIPNGAAREGDIRRILGTSADEKGGVGSVIVMDALPTEPVEMVAEVTTPHYGPWYQKGGQDPLGNPPADWYDPKPIPFLAVKEGQPFAFALLPNASPGVSAAQAAADVVTAAGWLRDALEWLGAGARTAVGFGRFGDGPLPEVASTVLPFPVGAKVQDGTGSVGTVLRCEEGQILVDFDGEEAWMAPEELEKAR